MITARQAHHMLAAGEDKATALGVPVNIALRDAGSHLKAFVRMDGAVLGSIDVTIRKARTAVLFETASEAVWDYCKPGAPAPGLCGRLGGSGSQIVEAHGRIDVVVHHAGHMMSGPAEAFTPEQLAELYDIKVLSTQRVNRAVLPYMRQQGQALLIWVSSSSTAGGTRPHPIRREGRNGCSGRAICARAVARGD
jgi:uncharacterized protein GlcG (DUF336 family)